MKSDLIALEQTFKEKGAKRALLLNMSVASHCPLLESAQEPLSVLMKSMVQENFEAPIVSNVTTKPYNTKDEAVTLLKEQLIKPVKYKQSIEIISNEIDLAIEFGNGTVLKGLNKRIAKDLLTVNISDMLSLENLQEVLNN
jgi:[acyl-carrier-protein] S-malonyltransferase